MTDFSVLEAIFENPASEAHMKVRNKAMRENINSPEVQNGRPFVCILGASHQMLVSGSLLSYYLNDHAGEVVLVKMLCKNCYTSTYTTTNRYFPFISALDIKKSQTELLEQSFDSMYQADAYTLIPEKVLLSDAEARKNVSVWYTLFRDQPKL